VEHALEEPRDLEAAAAQVEEQPVLDGDAADAAEETVARLGLALDHVDREAELVAEARHEGRPVLGVAQGRGRHPDDLLRARAEGERAEVAQGADDAVDRLGREAVAAVHVADETEGGAAAGPNPELAGGVEAVRHHPRGVGADVDDGDGPGSLLYGQRWPR